MKLGRSATSAVTTVVVVVGTAVLLSILRLDPGGALRTGADGTNAESNFTEPAGGDTAEPGAGDPGASDSGTATGATAGPKGTNSSSGGGGSASSAGSQACRSGANGGATDVGVTADRIKLAATIVDDGPGASFLGPVRIGMKAVVDKANRSGGVCGRSIDLVLRNDSWDAQRGQQYIQNFVEGEKVFALAVVPSSEGLRAADSYIRKAQVPVVGTDGMLAHQYTNPWIWPVATPTISTMHLMVQDAYNRGAREFGIVFDAKYRFGVEGAYAFNQAVRRLTNKDVPGFNPDLKSCVKHFCGIQPNRPSYTSEAKGFVDECYDAGKDPCEFIAYLLEPDTARTFMSQEPRIGNPFYGMGGAQPLFNKGFAEACGELCSTMRVWTGYFPPIESFAARPAVNEYVNDLRAVSGTVDVVNQFVEGGYVGMKLMVEALKAAGPNLTRVGLRQTLDRLSFDSGLANPMRWSSGNHFANVSAHSFLVVRGGWRATGPMQTDPWPGQDALDNK